LKAYKLTSWPAVLPDKYQPASDPKRIKYFLPFSYYLQLFLEIAIKLAGLQAVRQKSEEAHMRGRGEARKAGRAGKTGRLT